MELIKPFAVNGEREDFSVDTDPEGKVSLDRGFTQLYEMKPTEGGLFILRKIFNQMMYLVTNDAVKWKTQTFGDWNENITYPKNAIVKYTDGNSYVSKINNNITIPTNTNNWINFEDFGSSDRIGLIDYGYAAKPYHIVAFGGEFNRADYPKLWAYLQANPTLVKTQAQWTTESTTNGGICGFYSSGNGTTTFRVPNLDGAFLRPSTRAVGNYETDTYKQHQHTFGISGGVAAGAGSSGFLVTATGINGVTSAEGGVETRPKNIAVLPLIVAK